MFIRGKFHHWRIPFGTTRRESMLNRLCEYRSEMRESCKLYAIACPGFVKLGRAKDPEGRLNELQVGNPHPLALLTAVSERFVSETDAHERWSHIHRRGEWFEATPELLEWIAQIDRFNYYRLARRIDTALDYWKRRLRVRAGRRRAA